MDTVSVYARAIEVLEAPVAQESAGNWPAVLNQLGILPSVPAGVTDTPSELLDMHTSTMRSLMRTRLPVRFLGYAPLFEGTRVYHGNGVDWAMMSLTSDPLYYANGEKLIIPRVAADDLQAIARAGIDFHAVFIAHEVPMNSVRQGQSVPLELIAPPPAPEISARARIVERTSEKLWNSLALALRSGVKAATVATAIPFALMAGRDPVLFGVNFSHSLKTGGLSVGMWYYLTHWFWPSGQQR